MSKEKAREFLARLKALEAEFDASIIVDQYDSCERWVHIGDESYEITMNDELTDDVRTNAAPGRFTGEVIDLSAGITPLPSLATPFLKKDAEKRSPHDNLCRLFLYGEPIPKE